MNWHTGNIAEAVAESKAKDAVFVVYIEGQDEMSVKLDKFLSDSRISSKLMTSDFVAVKVQAESPTYQQFSSLYKVVPVPSIFFIGKSGTPLDVTTGIIENVDELVAKIDKVLILAGKQTNSEASTSKATENIQAERSIAGAEEKNNKADEVSTESAEATQSEECSSEAAAPEAIATAELLNASEETDIAKPKEASQSASAAVSSSAAAVASMVPGIAPLVPTPPQADGARSTTGADIQQRVEQKKLERQEEQKRLDKENELRRRREGRESQVHQTQTREQELKTMQDRIRRERLQEQQTRERILAQIAADRAEQANRSEVHSNNTSTATNTVTSAESSISSATDETRLQIRLPGGITRTKAFPVEEPLATVRVYVLNELLVGSDIRDFTLATSYPRREFKTEDELKTLTDLNLVPNAVLLVLKREQVSGVVRTGNNLFNILSSVLWAILTPATMAFDYLNKIGLQRIRQRFMQMVSNVGVVKSPGRPAAGNEGASAQDASARRNMGMFQGSLNSRNTPHMPDSTSDDATSTQNTDPQYQAPNMFFSEASVAQQAAQQRSGGAYKRYGGANIRRLADTTKDEDDKATYNGNSTQQQ